MEGSLLFVGISTTALTNIVSTSFTPLNKRCVFLLEDSNLVTIDFDATFNFLNVTIESAYKTWNDLKMEIP